MESAQELVLSKVLDAAEVESIDLPIRKKLEKFYETKISEFFTAKAISETAQKSIGEYRQLYKSPTNFLIALEMAI